MKLMETAVEKWSGAIQEVTIGAGADADALIGKRVIPLAAGRDGQHAGPVAAAYLVFQNRGFFSGILI